MYRETKYKGGKAIGVTYKGNSRDFIIESSLQRIQSHLDRGFFTVSGDRKELTDLEKSKNQKEIAAYLKANKLGYIPLYGHWIENAGTDKEVEVDEISFFVPIPKGYNRDTFLEHGIWLGVEYKQDGILYNAGDKTVYFIPTNPLSSDWGIIGSTMKIRDVKDIFSMLIKGNHKNIKFKFEGVIHPVGDIRQLKKESDEGHLSVI